MYYLIQAFNKWKEHFFILKEWKRTLFNDMMKGKVINNKNKLTTTVHMHKSFCLGRNARTYCRASQWALSSIPFKRRVTIKSFVIVTLRFGLLLFALKNVAERFKTKSMRFCFQLRTYSVVNIQKDWIEPTTLSSDRACWQWDKTAENIAQRL